MKHSMLCGEEKWRTQIKKDERGVATLRSKREDGGETKLKRNTILRKNEYISINKVLLIDSERESRGREGHASMVVIDDGAQ